MQNPMKKQIEFYMGKLMGAPMHTASHVEGAPMHTASHVEGAPMHMSSSCKCALTPATA